MTQANPTSTSYATQLLFSPTTVQNVEQSLKKWISSLPTDHLEQAAPLALAAFCQKENLKLSFSRLPCTDGRTVWLGPVSCEHPLAPVYIYGHGLHERGHVLYSDFAELQELMHAQDGELIFQWTNVLEDTRVDALTQRDYPGFATWREALYRLYFEAKLTPLALPIEHMMLADVVKLYTLLLRNEKLLHALYARADRKKLEARFIRVFGSRVHQAYLELIETMNYLKNTHDAIVAAGQIIAFFRQACQKVQNQWQALQKPVERPTYAFEQQSLFETPQSRDQEHAGMTAAVWRQQSETLTTDKPYTHRKTHHEECGFDWERLHADPTVNTERLYACLLEPQEHREATVIPSYKRNILLDRRIQKMCAKEYEAIYAQTSELSARLEDLCRATAHSPRFHRWDGIDIDRDRLCEMALQSAPAFWTEAQTLALNTDIVFLVDSSGSMSFHSGFTKAKVLCARLIEALAPLDGIDSMVALFPGLSDTGLERVLDVGEPVRVLHEKIAARGAGFGTPIYHALMWAGMQLVSRPQRRKIIFTITDGVFKPRYIGELPTYLKDYGIEIATVYIHPRIYAQADAPLVVFDDRLLQGKAIECYCADHLGDAAVLLFESLLNQ